MNIQPKNKAYKYRDNYLRLPYYNSTLIKKFYTIWFPKYGTLLKKKVFIKLLYYIKKIIKKKPLFFFFGIIARFTLHLCLTTVKSGWVTPTIMMYFTEKSHEKLIYTGYRKIFNHQISLQLNKKLFFMLYELNNRNSLQINKLQTETYYDGLRDLVYTHYRWPQPAKGKKSKIKKKIKRIYNLIRYNRKYKKKKHKK